MAHTQADKVIALAGVFQAAWLVNEVARKGAVPADPFACIIESVFEIDPPDTLAVYSGIDRLGEGLRLVVEQLGGRPQAQDMQVARYVLAILHLERKLVKNAQLMQKLREGVERARIQVTHFSSTHQNVIASLADLYVNTVSTLTPRIIVGGEHGHLTQAVNINKVRALLLAAIRSAVLWRQNGGTRMQLLFGRRHIAAEAARLSAHVHKVS
ncbi:MAG: high frequency lysogenization protein HflD [Chromatiales bacterium]|jgi:high frequency lysogenization protein|nr:high frequency lysogenization protein HflD [Chromatiales bacterium]